MLDTCECVPELVGCIYDSVLNLQVNVLNACACVFNLLISILLFLTCSFVLINVEHFKTLSIGHHI